MKQRKKKNTLREQKKLKSGMHALRQTIDLRNGGTLHVDT